MSNQDEARKPQSGQGDSQSMSRRKFLVNSGYTVGGAILGGVIGYFVPKPDTAQHEPPADQQPQPQKNYTDALMFFTQEQFNITQAATERIFPADDNGPGATDLGVAYFIDHQLAAEWGYNARDYMQPPFFVGEKEQGYQGRLNRREIFNIGLREMQNYCQTKYSKAFTALAPEEQDAVLTAFQEDEVKLTTISASGFFSLLRSSTLEGVYSDPLYGGNRNMQGWAMRSYPGSQMAYTQVIEKDFTKIQPRSLRDHVAHS
ncbi:gluconate 2-dehydrogenase subunit 3 family protein [Paenibacillus thermotolerans]|uniref:gluconate 2-dehydrogenase subunit 3 family protein n=1 Tax=Paenibacillus thermotolerans TaxID=3027807 RepID=UPI0023678205|nr:MULTISPECIES: gluconate 2-dehydrogenase subunit 3 family protein [unclassified Paenibacillus]